MLTGSLGETLLFLGIGIMSVAAVGLIVVAVCLRISKLKLDKRLDREFGKKRH